MVASQNVLARAISSALNNPARPALSYENIIQLAKLALQVNERIVEFLAQQSPISEERQYLTAQLFRASFDYGRASLFLLSTNPHDMGAAGFVLHRAQLESLLRAIYLGYMAEDYQLDDFAENEKIRKKNEKGKWENIGVVKLAELVQEKINDLSDEELEDPDRFTRMVANTWEPLCGFVHGGRAISAFYTSPDGSIGCSTPPSVLFQCICNSFVVSNFGFLTALARIYQLPGIHEDSDLRQAMTTFMKLQRQLLARREVGT